MNTDKIIAESIAKDYAPKESSKIVALKKLDKKAKLLQRTDFTFRRKLSDVGSSYNSTL